MAQPKNYDRWKQWCDIVQSQTVFSAFETEEEKQKRISSLLKDYSAFVEYYFPHYCTNPQTGKIIHCAPFHVQAANKILKNPNLKAVFQWARGHAKSSHLDVFIPMFLKAQPTRQLSVMVLVGKSQDNANTLLSDLQAELNFNQRYISDFGQQYSSGLWTEGEFVTKDECAFFARGRGQSPRGLRYRSSRPDYIIIDDLDDDELCKNERRVRELTLWVKEALFGATDGGRGRFIMVGNLISKNSVLYNLSKTKGVFFSKVNAYDKNGNVSWADKWTQQDIRQMEDFMGYRSFQKEMMNNPIIEGAVFRNDWIRWKKPYELKNYDQIVAYCDPSFKGSSKNDYKAIKVWGKKGSELHHLFAFVRQCSVSEMVRWFYDLHEKFLASNAVCSYYIEANFLQDILLDEFALEGNLRGYQLPIRADKRKKPDKFQRIEAISPLWERGFVFYNIDMQNDNDMLSGIEQTLALEKGSSSHDDAPDADEGAIYILQRTERHRSFDYRLGKRQYKTNSW